MSDKASSYSKSELFEAVKKSVELFMVHDKQLLNICSHEQSLSFRIGHYLIDTFEPKYQVDCEFNRHGKDPKRLSEKSLNHRSTGQCHNQGDRPDIVVHSRGSDDYNLIFIEIKKKKEGRDTRRQDKERIEFATSGKLNYHLGIYIEFSCQNNVSATICAKYRGENWLPEMEITS